MTAYLRKAEEYLEAAQQSFDQKRFDAATSAAIHAGINAADVVTGGRSGIRASSPDHMRTVELLERAGKDGAEAAKLLRRLLPLKNLAEYDYAAVTKPRAASALRASESLVAIARRVRASLG